MNEINACLVRILHEGGRLDALAASGHPFLQQVHQDIKAVLMGPGGIDEAAWYAGCRHMHRPHGRRT